ncbi:hypothetical protein VPLG_00089 [Vibrio phage eugene 12A10]|uniref:hypothetical protein n=1 Tax=Vibrio phage eugene 12A10 TaxID=573172 RepID=UPI00035165EA|nr:hypothetical protein VPLG_00089 [Vibrio phage eugene 12A10]AGN51528.1 hypothetical protein VPLG_00089 [Vibrio phage eugene 12A10]
MTKSYDELLTDLSSYNERTKTATETYESSLGDIVTATTEVVKDRNNANKWASEVEDTLVDDGVNTPDYSANHYSKKAAASAGLAATIADPYKGLWPDTGGSAEKGDEYQTQTGGTPTGQYFTALQNTTVGPTSDDVNWRGVVSNQSVGGLTNYQASSVANMINGLTSGGCVVTLQLDQRWVVDDYYGGSNPNNSGSLFFKVVPVGTGTADGGKYIDVLGGVFQLEQNLNKRYSVKAWGAVLDQDMTIPTQNTLDYVSSIGGGSVYGAEGINYLSIANSRHRHPDDNTARICLLLPENVSLRGLGKDITTYQRVVAERNVNGVLMCNENYDRNGGFTADGNIEVHDFSITDGAASPNRAIGDLIGIGHCKTFKAYNIKGLNHDLHLFDICASDDVYIDKTCEGFNEVLDISASTVQIDGATSLGIWGLFQDSTATKNIDVFGNYKNIGALRTIDLFHADGINYENINIDCDVDGAYVANGSCVGASPSKNINVNGLTVKGELISNHSTSVPLDLVINPVAGKKVDDVDIDVKVKSPGKGGVRVGQGTAGVAGRWGTVTTKVRGKVESTYSGSNTEIFGAQYTAIDNIFISPEDNITISKQSLPGVNVMAALLLQDVKGDSDGGRYSCGLLDGGTNKRVAPIIVRHFFSVIRPFDLRISKPILEALSGCGHHLMGEDEFGGALTSNDEILMTEAKFIGSAAISNIHEPIKISDGSNGYRQVQLDGSTFNEFPITSPEFYINRNIGMKKTGDADSPVRIKLEYAPNPGTLDTDQEDLNFAYISATQCAGTQIVDIQPSLGVFSIVTGSDGVSAVINNTTGQPALRASGVIKAWASI